MTTLDLEKFRIEVPSPTPAPPPTSGEPSQPGGSGSGSVNASITAEGGFYYIPNFLTEHEQHYVGQKVSESPMPKWKALQNRRLQYWGGQVSASNVLIPEPLPDFITEFPALVKRIRETGAFEGSKHGEPNHCLVNEYKSAQGIMPHEDGGAYFPAVATISLGSYTLLDIYRWATPPPGMSKEEADRILKGARAREKEPAFSILQEPGSLLITTGRMYTDYLHGIAERSTDGPAELSHVINASHIRSPRIRAALAGAGAAGAVAPSAEELSKEQEEKEESSETAQETEERNGDGENAAPAAQARDDQGSLQRETRISLTFRDVERVAKGLGGVLGGVLGRR